MAIRGPRRSNSRTPSSRSSARMCCETEGWLDITLSAALVTVPCNAALQNARSCLSRSPFGHGDDCRAIIGGETRRPLRHGLSAIRGRTRNRNLSCRQIPEVRRCQRRRCPSKTALSVDPKLNCMPTFSRPQLVELPVPPMVPVSSRRSSTCWREASVFISSRVIPSAAVSDFPLCFVFNKLRLPVSRCH